MRQLRAGGQRPRNRALAGRGHAREDDHGGLARRPQQPRAELQQPMRVVDGAGGRGRGSGELPGADQRHLARTRAR